MKKVKRRSCFKRRVCGLLILSMIFIQLSGLGVLFDVTFTVTKAADTEAEVGELSGTGYTVVPSTDGVSITYTPGLWYTLDAEVTGHDVTKQDKLQIVVTPARAGMNLGICYNGDNFLRSHWGGGVFASTEEQTLTFDLSTNITALRFYCDPTEAVIAEEQTFSIKSITFLDASPVMEDSSDIIIDGDNLDWDNYTKLATDTGIFTQVAAFKTDINLYIMYELNDASSYANDQFFLNADGDGETGYSGIDYMILGTSLYSYSGTGADWSWSPTGSFIKQSSSDNIIAEFKVPLSAIGNPEGNIGINIGILNSSWAYIGNYPASSTQLATIPSYEDAFIASTSAPLSDFVFQTVTPLKAITSNTLPGGEIGTLSATGGDELNYQYSFATSSTYGIDNSKFVINGDKIYVADQLLAPGNYSIYVKVISDIRSMKKAFTFAVAAADSFATITEDIFKGSNGEWFAVDYNAANVIPNLTELKSVSDGTYLYGFVSARLLSNNFEFYISVENRSGLDLSGNWADADNINFKIDHTQRIMEWSGTSWVDSDKEAFIYKTDVGAEFKILISDITDSGTNFKIAVKDGENAILPNQGQSMLQVTSPIMSAMPSITADGNPLDWTGIEAIAEGSETLGSLYAMRDNNYLYIMSYINPVDLSTSYALSTNLLINTDAQASTGYQHLGYPAASGADFLVEDWFSNTVGADLKNVEFFYTNSEAWNWSAVAGNTSYKAYAETGTTDQYCIEYAIPISAFAAKSSMISDDFYIAIDRENLQTGTLSGYAPVANTSASAFVKVPKYQTSFEISIEDGTLADWISITNSVSNTASDALYNLFATKSQERLYTMVSSVTADLNTVNTYYINTDNSTGYSFDTYQGVDYIVKDAMLYHVAGDNTLGVVVSNVDMNYYSNSIEMQCYLEDLGSPLSIQIAYVGKSEALVLPVNHSYMAVTASFQMYRDVNRYYPKENFASFGNPYKGWVTWGNKYQVADEIVYDYDTVYIGIKWNEIENIKGTYNFDYVEDLYKFDYWLSKGKKINLRFIMDNPLGGFNGIRMDIPQWLYDELVVELGEENVGTFYHGESIMNDLGGSGFSPNYESQLLQDYHERVIEALAERYDDTSKLSFVQIGSLGHWGEFHTWPAGSGIFPSPTVSAKYMEHYSTYFHNVKLGLRKPYPYAAANHYGLFNDVFGVSTYSGTYTFLNYINNGCTDMGPLATADDVINSAMPDFWKTNYSGGEFAEGNILLHVTNNGIVRVLEQIRDTHVSWLGPCSPADLKIDSEDAYTYEANILAAQKLMGYRYALESVTKINSTLIKGQDIPLTMLWNNKGVAPLYYNWPMELSLINSANMVVYSQKIDVDITEWLPGKTEKTVTFKVPEQLSRGDYTLAVAILNKDTMEPGIKLAIEGGRNDLRYPLYTVSIIGNGNNGQPPIIINPIIIPPENEEGSNTLPFFDPEKLLKEILSNIQNKKSLRVDATLKSPNIMLPENIIKALSEYKKSLTFAVRNEKGDLLYEWVFDGKVISKSIYELRAIQLIIETEDVNKDEILNSLVEKAIGNAKGMLITFTEQGILPGQVMVKLNATKEYGLIAGDIAYLYRYDRESGKLLNLANNRYKISKDGYVSLRIVEGGDYVIIPGKSKSGSTVSLLQQVGVSPNGKKISLLEGKSKMIDVNLPGCLYEVKDFKDIEEAKTDAERAITVTFSSSNKAIATVDRSGKIKAIGKGTVVITTLVELFNGKQKTYKTTVVVK